MWGRYLVDSRRPGLFQTLVGTDSCELICTNSRASHVYLAGLLRAPFVRHNSVDLANKKSYNHITIWIKPLLHSLILLPCRGFLITLPQIPFGLSLFRRWPLRGTLARRKAICGVLCLWQEARTLNPVRNFQVFITRP